MDIAMACASGVIFCIWHSFCDSLAWRIYTAYYSKQRKTIANKVGFILEQSSRCEYCAAKIPWFGLVPVFGYFFVGKQCRNCQRPISLRLPVFEGLAFIYGIILGALHPSPADFAVVLLAYALVWLVITMDYRVLLIPTEAIFSLMILGLFNLLVIKHAAWYEFRDPGLGLDLAVAFVWFFLFHMLRILSGYKMGLADVRLVLALGFLLGHPHALFLPGLAAFFAIVFYLIRRRSILLYAPSETHIPFGVFLGIGYLCLNLAGRIIN